MLNKTTSKRISLANAAPAALRMAGLLPLLLAGAAHAQTLEDAIKQTTVTGQLGAYDFTYNNNNHTPNTTNGFAVGGDLIVHSGALDGFSIGLGGYTAQTLDLYPHNSVHDGSPELASSYHSIQSLRESYLQYENSWLELRGGRQMINTPYADQDFYTFSPRAFMGIAGIINIIGRNDNMADAAPLSLATQTTTLSVFGARMFSNNERYMSAYTTGNTYLPNSNGFLVFGTRYQNTFGTMNLSLQGWYYDFYGLAQMEYGQADASMPLTATRSLFGAAQILSEGDSGSGNSTYGHVDAHVFGGKLGEKFGADSVAIIGDYSPVAYNSFRHGGIIHPYTDISGTIFTDTMQNGIEDQGPGYAYGITASIVGLGGKLDFVPTYVEYNMDYGFGGDTYSYNGPYGFPVGTPARNQAVHVIDAAFSYDLSQLLKGLSFDWDTDAAFSKSGENQQLHNPYFSSRVYVKYAF